MQLLVSVNVSSMEGAEAMQTDLSH